MQRILDGRCTGGSRVTEERGASRFRPVSSNCVLTPAHRLGPAAMKDNVSGYPSWVRGKTWPSLRSAGAVVASRRYVIKRIHRLSNGGRREGEKFVVCGLSRAGRARGRP